MNPGPPRRSESRPFRLGLFGFTLVAAVLPGLAQPRALTVMKNFQWPDYYEPPHEQQLRWLLKGAEARPQPSGEIPVQGMTLERFSETGARELRVELPECRFDPATREARSAGPLRAQFQEGRFAFEGEGFWWQHTNGLLVISNRVRTTIRGGWAETQPSTPALGDALVKSDQFLFLRRTTQAVYRGHVRVTGTNLALACERLSFTLPATHTGTVDKLLAEENVAIDFDAFHASGERALYETTAGTVRLTSGAKWQAQGREGRGDELLLDSATQSLRVNGGAQLQVPLGSAEFIPRRTNSALPPTQTTDEPANRHVTIASARYELQTNRVSFSGGVQVTERAGEELGSRLGCDLLVATFGASNQLETLVAEQGVVVEQGERRLSGARLTYDGGTGAMEFTGQPEWRDGERSGRGEVLGVDPRREEFVVRGNASLDLPPAQAGNLFGALVGGATHLAGKLAPTNAAPARPTRITCDEYRFAPEAAAFRGRVRVDGARMQLTTDAVALTLAPGGTNIVSIFADQNVVLSLVETNGQTTRVDCTQAVYAATNGVLELTGQPRWQRTDGAKFAADVISYEPATGELQARGAIRSTVISSDTNAPAELFKPKRAGRRK